MFGYSVQSSPNVADHQQEVISPLESIIDSQHENQKYSSFSHDEQDISLTAIKNIDLPAYLENCLEPGNRALISQFEVSCLTYSFLFGCAQDLL